jgi:hypothetical protein
VTDNWIALPLKTSPEFLEEIGFRGLVPSAHPLSPLASVKNALREGFAAELEKMGVDLAKIPRRRFALLYYQADPYVYDGKIGMEVEWWGPCEEVFDAVGAVGRMRGWDLGSDDTQATHALVHDRARNRWWCASIEEAYRFVRGSNEDL